jgi:23S rRNA pseudouridine2605 synthase
MRVYPVGRLDYDVSGIILLTNDGELANRLIHPKYKVTKTYIAKIKGNIKKSELKKLEKGVFLDDGKKTLPAKCKLIKQDDEFSIVELQIREGRKRQVKKMFESVKHPVIELKRIKFATVGLNDLKEGQWRYLTQKEVKKLYEITNLYKKD